MHLETPNQEIIGERNPRNNFLRARNKEDLLSFSAGRGGRESKRLKIAVDYFRSHKDHHNSQACGFPGAAGTSIGANVAFGGEVTTMVGLGGVSFGAGKAIDTNQNVCTVLQECALGGWGLYIGAQGTSQAGMGSTSTGSMSSIGFFGMGGVGPSPSITSIQVNADSAVSGQVGAGVSAGFGAGVKACLQVTVCLQ